MKAEDLIIGDLIRIGDNIGKICSISAANYKHPDLIEYTLAGKFNESSHTIGLERVLPIPLTKEILEKNIDTEYKHYENDHAIYGIGKYPKSVEITWFTKGGAEWTINGDEYGIVELHYIHELQHVLKLCGIEKEIAL